MVNSKLECSNSIKCLQFSNSRIELSEVIGLLNQIIERSNIIILPKHNVYS